MNNATLEAYCKSFPACHWGNDSIADYNQRIKISLEFGFWAVNPDYLQPVAGVANSKTRMVNEGTTPGPCGTCDKSCVGDCLNFCYAIAHGDGVYPTARENHIINTLYRRRFPVEYYTYFFNEAEKLGHDLRVNETGDFETAGQLNAFIDVARRFPGVRVIGYTKRENLLELVAVANRLENVQLHYSLACCRKGEATARAYGVPCTCVTFDPAKCTCPVQLLKLKAFERAYNDAIKDGAEEIEARKLATAAAKDAAGKWSCQECARKGKGCFADRDVNFFAH